MAEPRAEHASSGSETICPRCGERFACGAGGPCWCSTEAFRLPRAALAPGLGCYCPSCLAVVAAETNPRSGRQGAAR
ncbi:MAG: cysteine-rich CWC family protein [Alphaproteobacteria bacterium]